MTRLGAVGITRMAGWGLAVALALPACSSAVLGSIARGLAAGSGAPVTKLMLFGGRGHDTYLGCLNCGEYDSESVFNEYSQFGSAYSSTSIRNAYSEFGSRYSQYSACNPYASDPPVVVDGDGNYYGRLTLNRYRSDVFKGDEVLAWLAAVCEH